MRIFTTTTITTLNDLEKRTVCCLNTVGLLLPKAHFLQGPHHFIHTFVRLCSAGRLSAGLTIIYQRLHWVMELSKALWLVTGGGCANC